MDLDQSIIHGIMIKLWNMTMMITVITEVHGTVFKNLAREVEELEICG